MACLRAYGCGVPSGVRGPVTTENVTVLFTDMVGSTALASSVAPNVADELRRGHFAILRQAVAEAGGTEVKHLGDGLMVVFGAPSAALSCAVAMQQGVDRDNRGRERPVGLRVGLSGGEVSREDDDYFGDPVIEAARLCACCESGQVLAADIVRLTAGRRSRHECRSLGELTLKGLPDPVETVEVLWEPPDRAEAGPAVPLPGRLAVGPTAGVVGREAETAAMLDAYKRVAEGEVREVFLVSGEAGLGKTTLVAATARAAFDGGACVLFGHCEEDLATPISCSRRRSATSSSTPARSSSSLTSTRMVRRWPGWSRRFPAGCRAFRRRRRPTLTASVTSCSPRWWGCWSWRRSSSRSWSCWRTCSGPTRRACSCSAT